MLTKHLLNDEVMMLTPLYGHWRSLEAEIGEQRGTGASLLSMVPRAGG